MKLFSSIILSAISISPSGAATYYWTSGGDGASVYQEANWTENLDGSGGTIPVINGNTAVNHDLIVSAGNPGGGGGAGSTLDLGSGSLTINTGTFKMNVGNGAGINNADIFLNVGTVITEFVSGGSVTLAGGTLDLYEGDNPIDSATVNFTSGSTAVMIFRDETVLEVNSEHLAKIFVNGAAAVSSGAGQNVVVTANASGTVVMLGTTSPTTNDDDLDGLSNGAEAALNTNPNVRDSDGDGTPDGLEVEKGLDPTDDSDGLERPNIIFFFVDDLGYGDLGCFWQDQKSGTQKFDTPGIDTMAAEGAKMTHHYISASVCAPSRASLLQGRHQGHADVRDSQFDRALPNNHGMADTLRRAGYRTIHVGKNGLAGGEGGTDVTGTGSQNLGGHPLDRGFDDFFGYLFHGDGHEHYPQNGTTNKTAHIYDQYQQVKNASIDLYTTDAWTAYAKKAIVEETNDGDGQPFFLYLAYETPHFKMQRPAVAYPTGGGFSGGVQWTTETDGAGDTRYASTATGNGTPDAFDHPDNGASWPTAQKQHVGMIRRIDNSVADIIQLLKDLDIDDNTICVFSSDNGPHNEGNNPRYFESYANMEGIKRDMWEAGIRVPTVVRWPGNIAGSTDDENNIKEIAYPSSIWDWMPTFADLAEVPAPSWCDGVSLVPTLTGSGTQRDKGYLYFEFNTTGTTPNWTQFANHAGDPKGQMQCIRIDDYMGIRTAISAPTDNFQIYDAVMDPGQAIDLATSLPDLQKRMKELALQSRRPGTVSRPYDSANVPSLSLSTEEGLIATSYEGIWTYVPEFRDLTAASSTMVNGFDLSARSRDQDVGILFEGFVEVPTAGTYSFFVESDSGANLFVHDAHVIDDDFNHTGSEQSASINLEAGKHPIRLHYRHGVAANHSLNVSWSGPGIAKEVIPASALVREVPPSPEPTANNDTAFTYGAAVTIAVLDNDTDDGAPEALSIDSVSQPANGAATITGDAISYTPDAGFYGKDRFTYSVSDGAFTATGEVVVTVTFQAADIWIPLNECAGASVFEAGGAIAGAMSGFANNEAARINGVHGKALAFDGSDNQVSLSGVVSASLPTGAAARTVMALVRAAPALENQTIFGYGGTPNGQRFSFRTNANAGSPNNHRLRLEVQGGAIIGATTLNVDEWYHVAVVCDDFDNSGTMNVDEAKLYVDGILDGVSSASSQDINTAAGSSAVLGGSNHSAAYSFAGDIDELRIFPSALSQSEIQAVIDGVNQEAAAWHRANFGPAVIDWNSDADGDGLTRLAEYAFGLSPRLADSGSVTQALFNSDSGKLELTIPRRLAGSHNLLYSLEASRDLQDWVSLSATETGSAFYPGDACFELATFEANASNVTEPVQFMRARVEFAD
ncbi:sulfatase-like hydrolase/transferase [Akkermansiaceae bacterium]|nr:sulfatase-like hydrolase/transferase [Akkermansiaceae bacterium]MDB4328554.1 sulfatase-like hydrolase/transferase [Akkermansiaceae bacterium]MDB4681490.1 sulfatase-like hydrolase/transferase [Akkermansiaceae bacterium]